MNNELSAAIDSLNLPEAIREDLKRDYLRHHSELKTMNTKSMVKMSSKDGRKAAIILWEDEMVTVIATSKQGNSHISTTNSPEMYYIAQKNYIDLGLEIEYAEEDGKEIGIR